MSWDETVEHLLVSTFGPMVVQKVINGYLDRIEVDKCREYILENKSLFEPLSDNQWEKIRKASRAGKINLNYDDILNRLNSHRPDVLAVITTTEGGVDWLRRQVEEARKRLTS